MAPGIYMLLVRNELTGEWRELGEGDPKELRDASGDEGIYVEVPTRSWHPYKRETNVVKQTRTLYEFDDPPADGAEGDKPGSDSVAEEA